MKTEYFVLAACAVSAIAPAQSMQKMDMAGHGTPSYMGKPALKVTSSLIAAGGGGENFSTATALTSMVGAKITKAEVAKLTKQYGKARVGKWLEVFDYAVQDAVTIAMGAKVQLPTPSLRGNALAAKVVKASMDKHGVIYTVLLLDKTFTHGIHVKVMDDIDQKFSPEADLDYHRITNQALYDLAKAFKVPHAKLAKLH